MKPIPTDQIDRLSRIAACAKEIRISFAHKLAHYVGRVHLRPTNSGITLVGLLPSRPQRGHGGYCVDRLLARFDHEFERWCVNVAHGRQTPEKVLQSFLISRAYLDNRRFTALRSPESATSPFDRVLFVTDELAVFSGGGKLVCDLLALRREVGRIQPVLIELKSKRELKRLKEQLDGYSQFLQANVPAFERLYSEVLGEEVRFTAPPEKWLVWPRICDGADHREEELAQVGIGVVQYQAASDGFRFYVGRSPMTPAECFSLRTGRDHVTDD